MPEHTSFFSYLIAKFPQLGAWVDKLDKSLFGKDVGPHTAEVILASVFVMLLICVLAFMVKKKIDKHEQSVIPDATLSLRTLFEILVGFVYDSMKDVMGPKRAKKFFPVVGTSFFFVLFGNTLGMIPGFAPPTSSWNITMGCALIVFIAFNYYGLKENGIGYIKHLAGPVWWLAWLILPLELLSLCIRPITLSVRLMLNMSVDHLLVEIFHGLFMWVLPVVALLLGVIVVAVQAYVFTLLTAVYIGLATEHEDHGPEHAAAH